MLGPIKCILNECAFVQVEQPEGDRMIIDQTDELLELTDLEDVLGFKFQNIRLLAKALTRRNVPYNTLTW